MSKIKVTRYTFKTPPNGSKNVFKRAVAQITVDDKYLTGVQEATITIDAKEQGGTLTIKTLDYELDDRLVEHDFKIPDIRET